MEGTCALVDSSMFAPENVETVDKNAGWGAGGFCMFNTLKDAVTPELKAPEEKETMRSSVLSVASQRNADDGTAVFVTPGPLQKTLRPA